MKRSGEDIETPQPKRPKLLRDTLGLPRLHPDLVQIYWSGYLGVRRQWRLRLGSGVLSILDSFCQEDEDSVMRATLKGLPVSGSLRSVNRTFFPADVHRPLVWLTAYKIFCRCSAATTREVRLVFPGSLADIVDHYMVLTGAMATSPGIVFATIYPRLDELLGRIGSSDVLFSDANHMDRPVLWIVVDRVILRQLGSDTVSLRDTILIVNNPPHTEMFRAHGYALV